MLGRRRRRGGIVALAGAGLGIAVLAGLLLWSTSSRVLSAKSLDEKTGCDPSAPARTVVILVDTSDRIAPLNQTFVTEAIEQSSAGKANTRVIVARFSGARTFQPVILFDRCNPGRGDDVSIFEDGPAGREDAWRSDFDDPLTNNTQDIGAAESSGSESYIADAIARAARAPAFHLDKGERQIVVISDLLENSAISHPYRDGIIRLPAVNEEFLRGISLRLVELPALPGAALLQSHANRVAWRDWCELTGAARCQIEAAGLATP